MKISELKRGMEISNLELCEMFQCSPQGGMRRSHATNTLILISNRVKSFYTDTWEGEVFHYTGMGQQGEQSLTFAQNKTLAESNSNGVTVHLFEVYKKNTYTYYGVMKLAGQPYTSTQKDSQGIERKVYIFPLICVSEVPAS